MIGFLAIFVFILCIGMLVVSMTGGSAKTSARLGGLLKEIDSHHTGAAQLKARSSSITQLLTASKYAVRKRAEKTLLRALRLIMMSSLILCAYTFGFLKDPPPLLKYLSILGAVIGVVPVMFLKSFKNKRKTAMEISLINVIDLVVIGLEAGMTLPAILKEIVAQEPNPRDPLKLEIEQMLAEMEAGLDFNKALRGLATRSEIQELQVLASAVVQAERVGSGLAQTFRIYGDDLRSSRRELLRAKMQKLPVKMLLPMVLFLLLPLMVLILAPAGLSMMARFVSVE